MIKLTEHRVEQMKEMLLDAATVDAKVAAFVKALHDEQKAIVLRRQTFWKEVKEELGLEGEFRYEDGRLFPVNIGPDGAPIVTERVGLAEGPVAHNPRAAGVMQALQAGRVPPEMVDDNLVTASDIAGWVREHGTGYYVRPVAQNPGV